MAVSSAPAPSLEFSYNNIWETEVQGGDYVQEAGGTLRTRLAAAGSGLTVGEQGGARRHVGRRPGDRLHAARRADLHGRAHAVLGSSRTGTFARVVGSYAPTYELDGADVSVGGGAGTFSVDDVAVREGQTFTFTVRRSSGAGTATVHWSVRDVGSAVRGQDYPAQNGGFAMAGDLAFAAGETSKTVTSIWTLDEGAPEPDETLQFHLSHPTNMRIARPTATATIVNDDTSLDERRTNVLVHGGPAKVTLRGDGPDEPDEAAAAPRWPAGHRAAVLRAGRRRVVGGRRVRHHRGDAAGRPVVRGGAHRTAPMVARGP